MTKPNIAIFASGTGTNFAAIADAIDERRLSAQITLLICDRKDAAVIQKAEERQIPVLVFNAKDYDSKNSYEQMLLAELEKYNVDWLILAGYMRLIGQTLLTAYDKKIVNIHPSLLPKFPGKDAIKQAFDAKEKTYGITIHYVDEGMDTGEIIAQASFTPKGLQTLTGIENMMHQLEHELYPQTLAELFK